LISIPKKAVAALVPNKPIVTGWGAF